MATNENEEFEFRARAEQEAKQKGQGASGIPFGPGATYYPPGVNPPKAEPERTTMTPEAQGSRNRDILVRSAMKALYGIPELVQGAGLQIGNLGERGMAALQGRAPKLVNAGDPANYPLSSDKALKYLGVDTVPQTTSERLAESIGTGMMGGGAGGVRGVLAGAGAGGASGLTREAGGGDVAQLLAGILGGLGGAYSPKAVGTVLKASRQAAEQAKSIPGTVTGKTAQEAAENLRQNVTSEAEGISQKATQAAQDKAKLLQDQAEMAAKAQRKAETRQGQAVGNMPGVQTVKEGGKYIQAAPVKSEIGDAARGMAQKHIDSLKAMRSARADESIRKSYDEAAASESAGQKVTDTEGMKSAISKIDKALEDTPQSDQMYGQLSKLRTSLTELSQGKPASFKSTELMRRKIGDAAFGMPEEGYAAISQKLMRDVYGDVSQGMKEFSPSFDKYLSDYKAISEKLNAAGTRLGKAVTGKDEGGFSKVHATDLPSRIFSKPEAFKEFVEMSGGNKEQALALARRHFASELEGKTAQQARDMLAKHRNVMREMPGLEAEITEKVIKPLETQEARATAAGKAAGDLPKQAEKAEAAANPAESSANALIHEMSLAKPDQYATVAKKYILAEAKAGRLPASRALELQSQIDALDKAYADKAQLRRALLKIAGGGLAAYGAGTAIEHMK